ncbi:hypothetical protein BDN72DRAFT_675623 [Pluteus cervinus]|uniref:Uncharacterized protein n=1 Tax=Pluteus cervinus TaxID=181527 RepID=A0ACD3ATH6_9AGAR|nr:hypothetical protein BDN72DRAFT_675623 [Pluteus cervinus]
MQGDCEELERDLEEELSLNNTAQDDESSGSTEDRELLTPTPERYVPPNTPLPGTHTSPSSGPSPPSRSFLTSSQIFLGSSPPTSRPSTTESSIYPKSLHFQPLPTLHSLPKTPSSEDETDLGSPMFPRTYASDSEADTPGTSPAISAKEPSVRIQSALPVSMNQSSWSLDSSIVDLGRSAASVEKEPMREKAGKRQRLASFISRFSVLPAPHPTAAGVVPGTWTSTSQTSTAATAEDNADADSRTPTRTPVLGKPASLKINTSFQPTRATHTPSTSTSTFVSAESAFSQSSSATSVSTGSDSSYPSTAYKPILSSMSTPAFFPLPPSTIPSYPPISPQTLGLDSDPFATHKPVRMSTAVSQLGTLTAVKSLEHIPSAAPLFTSSPIDIQSPVYPGDVAVSTPLTPSKKLRQTMHRASLGLGLKGLIGRVWERDDEVPPTPTIAWRRGSDARKQPTLEESKWQDFGLESDIPKLESSERVGVRMGIGRMSGVRLGINRYRGVTLPSAMTGGSKRKLVISGVSDMEGFEAVKAWCEGFGEIRDIQRKNGALYVDFRKASVADTVCRVQAQVYIKGAGSVSLSWCTSSKK